jgi:hypothetical protein
MFLVLNPVTFYRDRELDPTDHRQHEAVQSDVGERHQRRTTDRPTRPQQQIGVRQKDRVVAGGETLDPSPQPTDERHPLPGDLRELRRGDPWLALRFLDQPSCARFTSLACLEHGIVA